MIASNIKSLDLNLNETDVEGVKARFNLRWGSLQSHPFYSHIQLSPPTGPHQSHLR